MYKIICNDRIVDVVKKLYFYRYIPGSKFLSRCDASAASCFQGSKNNFYKIQGAYLPESRDYPIASYRSISQLEYDSLYLQLQNPDIKIYEKAALIPIKEEKIQQLKSACDAAIINGVTLRLNDGEIYQFELTLEDQLNLRMFEARLNNGWTSFIYHAKGKPAQVFDDIDMKLILDTVNNHILYHTTYFNLAKNCINNMVELDKISAFNYGDSIADPASKVLLEAIRGN